MKKRLILSLYLILLTSATASTIEPISSLGQGILYQAYFLPDGSVLRVMADHLEIVDPDTNAIIDKFAEGLNWGRVTLSPDGAWLAIITNFDSPRGPFIEIWEVTTRKLIRRLEPRLDSVSMVAFSTAAPLLAVTSRDQIHLWNWDHNDYLGEMKGERRPSNNCYSYSDDWGSGSSCSGPAGVLSLAFSPDGNFLAVGSQRPGAEIWDVFTRKLVGHLEGHVDWVTHIAYSPDSRYIATTRPRSTQIYLWNAQTRQLIQTLPNGDEGDIQKLLFSADSQRLYVATRTRNWLVDPNGRNDYVRVFDVHTGAQLNEFGDELFILQDFSLSPDEKIALFRYYMSEVVLWDIEHNRRLAFWSDYLWGYDWKLSPDGRSLVMVNGAIMKIWDVPSRSLRKVIVPHNQTFREFAISPDSQTIAVGQDPWIELRDIYTGEVTAQLDQSGHTAITFSQTGQRIATERRIFDVNNSENRQVLERQGDSSVTWYSSIAFSAGDIYLAAGNSRNNLIHLWEQQDDKYVYRYALHSPVEGVPTFIPSSDGVPILAVLNSKRVAVWELRESPQRLLIFELDARWPIHFSGDGRYLFANSEDGLQIWDWREKKQIQHPPLPEYLAVSRDASVIVTLNYETGEILIWDGRSLLPPEPALSHNVNRDGVVNILDLVEAASQFGQSGTHLTGDANGNGKVDVSDLELIGSHLGENAAAPSLHFSRPAPTVNYQASDVKHQFQALTALESLENPLHGTRIARDLLKIWLSRIQPPVTETKLLPNYPNPFNPETWLPYRLTTESDVTITIYNTQGQQVRSLTLGPQPAGSYLTKEKAAYWDGRNAAGEWVASGVYFYTLQVEGFSDTRKMLIQK